MQSREHIGGALMEGFGHFYAADLYCRDQECPVAGMNLFEALAYANARSKLESLPECYELEGCEGDASEGMTCMHARWAGEDGYTCAGYRLPMEPRPRSATFARARRALSVSLLGGLG